MKQVIVSGLLINKSGHMLLSRRTDCNQYCPAGGKVEKYESLEHGLAREIKEEIGVDIVLQDTVLVGWAELTGKVIFFYLIFDWVGEIKNMEPEKHGEWEWFATMPGMGSCVSGLRQLMRQYYVAMYDTIERKLAA